MIKIQIKFKIIKKLMYLTASILIIAAVFTVGEISKAASTDADYDLPIIIIDAGHGEFDGGAVAPDSTLEKDINLEISLKLQKIMLCHGYKVVMTRITDSGTDYSESQDIKTRKVKDMKNRLKLINSTENAIFVSVHLNKFDSATAKGAQVFYSPKAGGSKELGESIQKSIIGMIQQDNTRAIKQGTKNTYLLYYAENPAVIVECGFLSNAEELQNLKKNEYQEKMAFAISCGILEYIGYR